MLEHVIDFAFRLVVHAVGKAKVPLRPAARPSPARVLAMRGAYREWAERHDLGLDESFQEQECSRFKAAYYYPSTPPEQLTLLRRLIAHDEEVQRCVEKIRDSLLHMCRRYYYEHMDFENSMASAWASSCRRRALTTTCSRRRFV